MKKIYVIWLVALAVIMFFLPWLADAFVSGNDALGVIFLLFFAVNPLCAAVTGAVSGTNVRAFWSMPLICAVMYLAAMWIFFEPGNTAFLLYAAAYLVIGGVFMAISWFITRKMKKQTDD